SGPLPSNTIANLKGKLKAITTQSGIVLDGHSVPMPHPFINSEEDERVEPLHINITLVDALILMPKYQKMLKALLSNKEKLLEMANTPLNENCSTVILKKLPEKLGDPGKFLILWGFSELKCKTLADLDDFIIVDYESDPRVLLILGRPFLRTTHVLIGVHGEEMILQSINMINIFNDSSEDFLENLFATNHQSGNLTFSSHPNLTSPEVKDDIFDPEGGNVLIEKLLDLDSTKDLHPPHNVNPLSGSTTSFSPNHLLKEFADELALITFTPGNYDPLLISSLILKR
nr:reverse transcriptase domain-containing protein [Tanacetum cinerariifolium]